MTLWWPPLLFAGTYLLWLLWGQRSVPGVLSTTLWMAGAAWLLAVTAAYLWVTASPAPDTSLTALLPLFPFLFLATLSLALGRSRNRALAWACWGVTPCLLLTALLLFGLFH